MFISQSPRLKGVAIAKARLSQHVKLSPEEQDFKAVLQTLLIRTGLLVDVSERAWNEYCTHYVLRRELPKLKEFAAEQIKLAEEAQKKREEAAKPVPKKPFFE